MLVSDFSVVFFLSVLVITSIEIPVWRQLGQESDPVIDQCGLISCNVQGGRMLVTIHI